LKVVARWLQDVIDKDRDNLPDRTGYPRLADREWRKCRAPLAASCLIDDKFFSHFTSTTDADIPLPAAASQDCSITAAATLTELLSLTSNSSIQHGVPSENSEIQGD
jgi:hypothetical protein